jgi:GTP pyrophosphokinase
LHANNAKINGKLSPLKTILKTGDIVEILSSPEKIPRRDWLNITLTSTARHHIKRWLNLQDRIKNAKLGKKLWEREIKKRKWPQEWLKNENVLKRLSDVLAFRIKEMDDFYARIGFGKIVLDKRLMDRLFPPEKIPLKKDLFLKKVVTKVAKKPKPIIQVKGVKLAKCCSPIRGEPIVGYITSGKGITVHSLRCALVQKEILDSQRMVDVSWEDTPKLTYQGKLLIRGKDAPGVLANITSVIAQLEGNITKAEVSTFSDQKARIKLWLIIRDIKHFETITQKLSGIKEIVSVERI